MAARKKTVKKPTRKPAKKAVKKKAAKKSVKASRRKSAGAATKRKVAAKPARKSRPKAIKKLPPPLPTGRAGSFLGQPAPPFTLPTGDGQTISLDDFRGRRVLLYFYPKDDTPGCTAQACALRDNIDELASSNVVVVGVSKDDVLSHRRFKDKYGLNFLLASDKDTGVCEKYGVWVEKNMYGRKYMGIERSTFLIDETGIVRAEWRKVSVPDHLRDVQTALLAV